MRCCGAFDRAVGGILNATSGKRGLVLEKPRLLWVSLETIKTSKIQRLPGLPQTQVP